MSTSSFIPIRSGKVSVFGIRLTHIRLSGRKLWREMKLHSTLQKASRIIIRIWKTSINHKSIIALETLSCQSSYASGWFHCLSKSVVSSWINECCKASWEAESLGGAFDWSLAVLDVRLPRCNGCAVGRAEPEARELPIGFSECKLARASRWLRIVEQKEECSWQKSDGRTVMPIPGSFVKLSPSKLLVPTTQ